MSTYNRENDPMLQASGAVGESPCFDYKTLSSPQYQALRAQRDVLLAAAEAALPTFIKRASVGDVEYGAIYAQLREAIRLAKGE